MLIKQNVEILDVFHAFIYVDARQSCELDSRYESFAGAEHPLGNAGAHEHTVLARHQQITSGQAIAKGACCDAHGTQLWVLGEVGCCNVRGADPADDLCAAAQDGEGITCLKMLDGLAASGCCDQRAVGEAEDVLQVAK